MNVIVAGAGVGGYHIASMLTREGHSVVVIDQSESALENARRHLDVMTIVGSGSNPRVLRDADASEADLFIAFTASDEANIVACLLAKALGAKRTVARVRNPEYSGYLVTAGRSPIAPRRVVTPQTFGISLFVNPDIMAAEAIVGILFEPYTAPKEEFGGGLVEVRELKVESDAVVDKPLHGIPFPKKCVIGAIVRATGTVFPEDDEILHKDDRVVAVSSPDAMDELEAFFHEKEPHVRSIVIVGGQRVGFRLAQALHERGLDVLCEPLGFTESHTLVVDVEEHQGGAKVAKALEDANIIVNKNLLPWDSDPVRPSGIRVGSQEVTRLGMKEKDMEGIAELVARVVMKGESPSSVADDVKEFKRGFTKVHYCFFEGEEAYDYPSMVGEL